MRIDGPSNRKNNGKQREQRKNVTTRESAAADLAKVPGCKKG